MVDRKASLSRRTFLELSSATAAAVVATPAFGEEFGAHHSSILGGFWASEHAERPVALYFDANALQVSMWATHAAFHQFAEQAFAHIPDLWVSEGLASYYSIFYWDKTWGLAELQRDRPRADDEQPSGKVTDPEQQIVTRPMGHPVEPWDRWHPRGSAGRDDDPVGGQLTSVHNHGGRSGDGGVAFDDLHAVQRLHPTPRPVGAFLDDRPDALHNGGEVHAHLAGEDAELGRAPGLVGDFGRSDERLAGDTAPGRARAADHRTFDDGDAPPRTDRPIDSVESGHSCADDDEIV